MEKGINENTIEKREEFYDSNQLDKMKLKGFWKLLWEALEDFLLRILILCSLIVLILNYSLEIEPYSIAWIDSFAILVAVFLSSGITALNDYQKEKQFKDLSDEAEKNKII